MAAVSDTVRTINVSGNRRESSSEMTSTPGATKNVAMYDLFQGELFDDSTPAAKRKRRSTQTPSPNKNVNYNLRKKLISKLIQLDKEIKSLNELVRITKNTQTDIKKKISIISSINSIIQTDKMRAAIEDNNSGSIADLDNAEETYGKFKCRECGTENFNEDVFDRKIAEELNQAISWDNICAVCKKSWIPICYKQVSFCEEFPMEYSNVAYVTSIKEINEAVSNGNKNDDSILTGDDKFIFTKFDKIKYIHSKRLIKDNAINVYKDAGVFENDLGEEFRNNADYKILGDILFTSEIINETPKDNPRYHEIANLLKNIAKQESI
ncbi:hypothetical protein RN001_002443 [Aquatica leii]|uniref:Uncharacterized protein n=1 Tax=Aquatica leii TaxID=1421715 RepID=A0AAN7SK56_9COLE|nr:hypothetical protein RN001_002443 [Aquatica leii]